MMGKNPRSPKRALIFMVHCAERAQEIVNQSTPFLRRGGFDRIIVLTNARKLELPNGFEKVSLLKSPHRVLGDDSGVIVRHGHDNGEDILNQYENLLASQRNLVCLL